MSGIYHAPSIAGELILCLHPGDQSQDILAGVNFQSFTSVA